MGLCFRFIFRFSTITDIFSIVFVRFRFRHFRSRFRFRIIIWKWKRERVYPLTDSVRLQPYRYVSIFLLWLLVFTQFVPAPSIPTANRRLSRPRLQLALPSGNRPLPSIAAARSSVPGWLAGCLLLAAWLQLYWAAVLGLTPGRITLTHTTKPTTKQPSLTRCILASRIQGLQSNLFVN